MFIDFCDAAAPWVPGDPPTVSQGLAGGRGSSVAFVYAAAASMAVLGGQSQHEERRGALLLIGADLARRRPVGRSKGTKRPTNSVHGLGRDAG